LNPTRRLFSYLWREWILFAIGIISLFLGTFGSFVTPLYVGWVIDALNTEEYEKINGLTLQLIIIIAVSSIFVLIRAYSFNLISEKIAYNLRHDIFYSIIHKDVEFFDSRRVGDLLSRLSADTTVIQDGLANNVSMFLRTASFILMVMVVLFILSWKLTLATLAGILPLVIFGGFYGRAMKKC